MKITKRQIKSIIQNELKRKSVKEGTKKDYLRKGSRDNEEADPELAYNRQDEYEVYGTDQVLTGEYDMNDSIMSEEEEEEGRTRVAESRIRIPKSRIQRIITEELSRFVREQAADPMSADAPGIRAIPRRQIGPIDRTDPATAVRNIPASVYKAGWRTMLSRQFKRDPDRGS